MCRGAIQTRGNFSLPYNVPLCYLNKGNFPLPYSGLQARGNFPSDLRLCISRVGSVLVEHRLFANIVLRIFTEVD